MKNSTLLGESTRLMPVIAIKEALAKTTVLQRRSRPKSGIRNMGTTFREAATAMKRPVSRLRRASPAQRVAVSRSSQRVATCWNLRLR